MKKKEKRAKKTKQSAESEMTKFEEKGAKNTKETNSTYEMGIVASSTESGGTPIADELHASLRSEPEKVATFSTLHLAPMLAAGPPPIPMGTIITGPCRSQSAHPERIKQRPLTD